MQIETNRVPDDNFTTWRDDKINNPAMLQD
jgi:hypothetical protein